MPPPWAGHTAGKAPSPACRIVQFRAGQRTVILIHPADDQDPAIGKNGCLPVSRAGFLTGRSEQNGWAGNTRLRRQQRGARNEQIARDGREETGEVKGSRSGRILSIHDAASVWNHAGKSSFSNSHSARIGGIAETVFEEAFVPDNAHLT